MALDSLQNPTPRELIEKYNKYIPVDNLIVSSPGHGNPD